MKFYQKKFEPITETDQYFMEIKACYKAFRRTIPELYKDFSKSVINEFFNMNELVKKKNFYRKRKNMFILSEKQNCSILAYIS